MSEQPTEGLNGPIPRDFSLSVIMQRAPANSPWQEHVWEAIGVTASLWARVTDGRSVSLVHEQGEIRHYLYSGFRLQLHVDECESYYHNLRSPTPYCFVIASERVVGRPEPLRVSLSFDEANAYQEGGEVVYAVAMPPELYRWCELFVLNHFVPEKKKKRRLTDWRKSAEGGSAP